MTTLCSLDIAELPSPPCRSNVLPFRRKTSEEELRERVAKNHLGKPAEKVRKPRSAQFATYSTTVYRK